jgi:hypothetical protein
MTSGERTGGYLVECYWPGVSEETLIAAAQRARSATSALRRRGRDVEFLGSILVPADETVFALFTGCEADVRDASTRAGLPFERVLGSLHVDGSKRRRAGGRDRA